MKSKYFFIGTFLTLFTTNLALIFVSNDYPNIDLHCAKVSIYSSSVELVDSNPSCDTSSNLLAALNLFSGELTETTIKTLSNWPVGMPLLFKFFIGLEGVQIPIIVGFGLLISLVLSYFLTEFLKLAAQNNKILLGLAFIFIFMFSSPNEGWISGSGLLYPEGLSILMLALAMLKIATLESKSVSTFKYVIYISICFAIAAYFRAIFELQLNMLLAYFFLLFILFQFKNISRILTSRIKLTKNAIYWMLAICTLASALLLPWRIVSERTVHPGSFAWTTAYNKWWISWIPTEKLSNFNISFDSAQGGINMACELNPEACEKFNIPIDFMTSTSADKSDPIYLNTYISSIISNPGKYLDMRLSIIRNFWLQDNQFNYLREWNFTEGYSFLFILFASLIAFFFYFKRFILTSTVFLASISIQFLVLSLHHVEARYFIGIKLMSLTYVFLLIILSPSKNKEIESLIR
jgi:hypothetical protein